MRKFPFNILIYFAGLVLSRMFVLYAMFLVLCLMAYFMFGVLLSWSSFLHHLVGVFVGFFIFSFIGLILGVGVKRQVSQGLTNLTYFGILFTSNAFYPTDQLNSVVGYLGDMLPLNPLLALIREGQWSWVLIFWLLVPMVIFYFLFSRLDIKR